MINIDPLNRNSIESRRNSNEQQQCIDKNMVTANKHSSRSLLREKTVFHVYLKRTNLYRNNCVWKYSSECITIILIIAGILMVLLERKTSREKINNIMTHSLIII